MSLRFAAVLALLAAPALRGDALDDFVAAQAEKRRVPGLAWAVLSDREPARFGALGTADLAWSAPAASDTLFPIGALSKVFASTAAMLLVQDGALRLDARLEAILPGVPEAWGAVTVRQLLTETAGLPSFAEQPGFALRDPLPVTREGLVAAISRTAPVSAPGARWAAGDTGWQLVGMVVEKVSGLAYAEFLDRRIVKPAGLARTRLDDADVVIPRRAAAYDFREGAWRPAHRSHPSWSFAAGGVLSTARDLARFTSVLRDGTLLTRTSLEVMWTPVAIAGGGRFPFGFGWHLESYRGRRVVWQSGTGSGASSAVLLFPADGLAVVVVANVSDADPLRIARGIASFRDPALPSAERAATRPDADASRAERVRRALEEAASGTATPRTLAPGLAAALPTRWRREAAALLPRLRGIGLVTCDRVPEGVDVYGTKVAQICTVRLQLEEGVARDVEFWLAADGRVAWLDADAESSLSM